MIKKDFSGENKVFKNNIWISEYNLYICGKLEKSFFNFSQKINFKILCFGH